LNCEDEEKGLERALPQIAEAIAAGRLAAWVADNCQAGKAETLQMEGPRVDWTKVAAEVRRLAAVAPASREVEMLASARRFGQSPWLLDLFVKFAGDQRRRRERAPPFMNWVGGHRVLNCRVVLTDGALLDRRLNTADTSEGQRRMRLLLWHAIIEKQLPGGVKHEAWRLYGGPISEATQRLLEELAELPWEKYELRRAAAAKRLGYCETTIDWLTNQEEARRQDPVRQSLGATVARYNARKLGKKQTPISRAWQFSRAGNMLHKHKGFFYGRVQIDGLMLEWPLGLQNRTDAEARVKPAREAFERVGKAARDWRDCPKESDEARKALKILLDEQNRYRAALVAAGAKHSKRWPEVVKVLESSPFDETNLPNPKGATSWFVDLLFTNPKQPPRPLETVGDRIGLLQEAMKRFNISGRQARRCYETAQDTTGIKTWSTTHRGKARKSGF
jgi:hypothetical protein